MKRNRKSYNRSSTYGNSVRSHRLAFECLEDRRMLDGDPPFELVFQDTPLTGETITTPTEGLPGDFDPGPPVSLPRTTDIGDHYFYFDERIDLLRAEDEFVIAVTPDADVSAVVTSLTTTEGPLAGYELARTLDERRIVLSRPDGIPFTPVDLVDVESTVGVAWASPVFVGKDSGTLGVVTDEIIVALAAGVDPEEFFAEGYVSWSPLVANQYVAVLEDGGTVALDTANALATDNEDVEWAQPNMYVDFQQLTNDPLFDNQWTLENTSQFGARNDADADVVEAWNTTTGSYCRA
jgi:hypothetical protein